MNNLVILGTGAALALVMCLLSFWQRKISEHQKRKTIEDIREAKQRGTDRAVAQHPQIDPQACIGCGACIAACPENQVLGLVDGIAHVIHGSRCIGHGLCATDCPVAAIKIGLGNVSERTDLPILTERLETTVPGVYIAGELGGFALVRLAVGQGVQAVDQIARELRPSRSRSVLDLLIVGAGPAGLGASLKAVEHGLKYATIDQQDIGGTVRKYPRRKLTLVGKLDLPLYGPVNRDEYQKEELIAFWEQLIDRYELKIHTGIKLLDIERQRDALAVRTSHGEVRARRVLLALGRRGSPRKIGVPGEESEKVLYQLIDTATYANEHILVVGGGDSAVEAAIGLASQPGNVVTLSYRRADFFRLKPRNERRIEECRLDGKVRILFNSNVQSIETGSVVLSYSENGIERTSTIKNDYSFVLAGGEPPYSLLRNIGVQFGGDGGHEVSVTTSAALEPIR